MAKKKLTLEEVILEDSLYEKPMNWEMIRLKSLFESIQYGYTESANTVKIGPHFLRITDIKDNKVFWDEVPYCKISAKDYEKYVLNKNDIVVARTGATTGKNYIIKDEVEAVFASYLIRLKPIVNVNSEYVSKFMDSDLYWNQIIEKRKGSAQPGVNAKKLGELIIPLAPLQEQERIVNRIESLFEKLDKAKELIEEARAGFENRKAAILEKAFRGELTKAWRKQNKQLSLKNEDLKELKGEYHKFDYLKNIPSEWKCIRFNQCCIKLGSGSTPRGGREVYTDCGIPFIRSQNVLKGKMELRDIVYISKEIHEKMNKTKVMSGDTLLNITGASIGRATLLDSSINEANVNQHVCIFRFKEYVFEKYPQYWFNSVKFQKIIADQQIGATREALNFKQLRGMYIPLATIAEQKEIVRIIDRVLNDEEKIEKLTQLDKQIKLIKKSILAKAFRGELGTNDPEEESAMELLKEILSEK